jgi:cytochrome b6-f complex iron-sulfur subunit
MDRRNFIQNSGVLICGCALTGSILQACKVAGAASVKATRDGEYLVFPESELEGHPYAVINHPDQEFPIYVSGKNGAYSAVLLKCSHKGCELEPSASILTCPCHGSTFKPTGEVIQRPATVPLDSYEVTVSEGRVRIKV